MSETTVTIREMEQMREEMREALKDGRTMTDIELPSVEELDACIEQAPIRWQGVVMAAVTLQGRSAEAALDAVKRLGDHRLGTKEKLGQQTATELLERERVRRLWAWVRLGREQRMKQSKALLRGYGGGALMTLSTEAEARWTLYSSIGDKMDDEMMRTVAKKIEAAVTHKDSMNSVFYTSIIKDEDIS